MTDYIINGDKMYVIDKKTNPIVYHQITSDGHVECIDAQPRGTSLIATDHTLNNLFYYNSLIDMPFDILWAMIRGTKCDGYYIRDQKIILHLHGRYEWYIKIDGLCYTMIKKETNKYISMATYKVIPNQFHRLYNDDFVVSTETEDISIDDFLRRELHGFMKINCDIKNLDKKELRSKTTPPMKITRRLPDMIVYTAE